jgi:hypothetical protein
MYPTGWLLYASKIFKKWIYKRKMGMTWKSAGQCSVAQGWVVHTKWVNMFFKDGKQYLGREWNSSTFSKNIMEKMKERAIFE